MLPWQTLLEGRWRGIRDQFGPHSHAAWSAMEQLAIAPWLEHVGAPIAPPPEVPPVIAVSSWADALQPFSDHRRYGPSGTLRAPAARVNRILTSVMFRPWIDHLAAEAADRYDYSSALPEEPALHDRLWEYLYELVLAVQAEIIGTNEVDSTYFREQLAWICAGHLPCGWDGDWPVGQMRVF